MNVKVLRTIMFFSFQSLNFFYWINFCLLDAVRYKASWLWGNPWVQSNWRWLIKVCVEWWHSMSHHPVALIGKFKIRLDAGNLLWFEVTGRIVSFIIDFIQCDRFYTKISIDWTWIPLGNSCTKPRFRLVYRRILKRNLFLIILTYCKEFRERSVRFALCSRCHLG